MKFEWIYCDFHAGKCIKNVVCKMVIILSQPGCVSQLHYTWVRSRRCSCLVTWFCYQLIAKPGNKTAAPSWPDPHSPLPISYITVFFLLDVEKYLLSIINWFCLILTDDSLYFTSEIVTSVIYWLEFLSSFIFYNKVQWLKNKSQEIIDTQHAMPYNRLIGYCKTAASPLFTQWRYVY